MYRTVKNNDSCIRLARTVDLSSNKQRSEGAGQQYGMITHHQASLPTHARCTLANTDPSRAASPSQGILGKLHRNVNDWRGVIGGGGGVQVTRTNTRPHRGASH